MFDTTNFITSCKTGRYLFEAGPDGDVTPTRVGAEGGWIHENNKPVLTADSNYFGRAHWKIVWAPGQQGKVFIQSYMTGRCLFDGAPDGDVCWKRERGAEDGWIHKNNKPVLIQGEMNTDITFVVNRALWRILPVEGQPGKVFIESCETGRYLFEAAPDGDVSSKRGDEGGWSHENNKPVLTADANYHNRAYWKIEAVAPLPKWKYNGYVSVPPHTTHTPQTQPYVIRKALPNVRSSKASDIEQLWGAVDTAGVAPGWGTPFWHIGPRAVPIAFLELTWSDQGYGGRKGHLHARKDGGAWRRISTDAAEHELTRESFEIPAELLGGKLELGFSVGSQSGHRLTITNAEVEITERKDLITVGNHSGKCPKVVTLPSAGLMVGNAPVNPQGADWNDKFRVEVEGNVLKVFRVDAPNCGWGQQLVLGAL